MSAVMLTEYPLQDRYLVYSKFDKDLAPVGQIKLESNPCMDPENISTDVTPDFSAIEMISEDYGRASGRDVTPNYYPTEVERYKAACTKNMGT